MIFDTASLTSQATYQLLSGGVTPRPIAWISTLSHDDIHNIAPYSFFNVVSCTPPVLMYSQVTPQHGRDKDTLQNLLDTKECVVHIIQPENAQQMNLSCANLASNESEFEWAHIATHNSHSVRPLSVTNALVRYECQLREVIRIGNEPGGGSLVLLNVKYIDVADSILENTTIKQHKLNSIGKMGGDYFTLTQNLFEMQRPQ